MEAWSKLGSRSPGPVATATKEKKTHSSLDESGLLMEVIIGAEFGWERGTERCAEAPLAGLVAT